MSERTLADIEADIKSATDAREARAAIPSEDGKWDESRAIFIENCNNRIEALVKERNKMGRVVLGQDPPNDGST